MKKFFAIALAVAMFASMATVASAAENTTTLTTNVPAASYTLNIPADQEIPFGATLTDIGSITVTNGTGFAKGKNLAVMPTFDAFICEDASTTIPFSISLYNSNQYDEYKLTAAARLLVSSGSAVTFLGQTDGSVAQYCTAESTDGKVWDLDKTFVHITSENWGKALAGEYTATITFTAEVVVE